MKRDVAEILETIVPVKDKLEKLPAVQRLFRMRKWMERRLWRRARVRIPVALTCKDEKRIAVVTDISAKGLRLSGIENVSVGDSVTVAMRGFAPLTGTIVWAKGSHAGMLLSHALLE